MSSECLVNELLSGIDLVQVPFRLGELRIQIELHQLLEALIPVLGKRVSQQTLDPGDSLHGRCRSKARICRIIYAAGAAH